MEVLVHLNTPKKFVGNGNKIWGAQQLMGKNSPLDLFPNNSLENDTAEQAF
jgi:hypothetical protein